MTKSIKTRIISIATAALMTLSVATATMASASAATIDCTQAVATCEASKKIILSVRFSDEWKSDGARFAAYFYNCVNNTSTWSDVKCTVGYMGNLVSVEGDYTHVIFVRLNPNSKENNFVKGNAWNKTADIKISDIRGAYQINGWELDVE